MAEPKERAEKNVETVETVRAISKDTPANAIPESALYHVGVHPEMRAPFEVTTIAGICFPLYTEKIYFDKAGNGEERARIDGDVLKLTREEVLRVRDAAVQKDVIRWTNAEKKRALFVSTASRGYQKSQFDEPVGKYVYMGIVQTASDRTIFKPIIGV